MISKEELIIELADRTGVSKDETSKIYEALIAFVTSGLKTSPVVVLPELPPIGANYSKTQRNDRDEQASRLLDALGSNIFSSLR